MEVEGRLLPLPYGWTEKRVSRTTHGTVQIEGNFVCAITKSIIYTYDENGEPRCGARVRGRDGTYHHCPWHPVNGSNRCRWHGGSIPAGRVKIK